MRELGDDLYFGFIDLNHFARNDMTQDNSLDYHKVALLTVEEKVDFLTTL